MRPIPAAELARELGLREPTPEQQAVIEAAPGPQLVVAGAGSGKTETMAGRVVWLVANGLVEPGRVLGLTFTRKAAGELAHRIRLRLAQLRRAGLAGGGPDAVLAGEPTISTYHAYAARLLAEHALRAGCEPSSRPLSETARWQLAYRVVQAYDHPDMDDVDAAFKTVVGDVLALSADMAEHLVTAAAVAAADASATRVIERVRDQDGLRADGDGRKALSRLSTRRVLLPLVEAFAAAKREAESSDFGDQMSLAARIAERYSDVGALERERFEAVLLDEYQDTGHSQRVLLRSLYAGGHSVTAVGDPCQSIYGWRGASAGNLAAFSADFCLPDGEPAPERALSVSFRNRERILEIANRTAADLRSHGAKVPLLQPGPGLTGGAVEVAQHETCLDEAGWLAERLRELRTAAGGPLTAAVLVRRRSQIPALRAALLDAGVPVDVPGVGGLLLQPEVVDAVAVLRVVADPTAGSAAARLLTGPRWRVGARDLAALGRRARQLAPPRARGDGTPADPDEVDEGSLIAALDDPGDPAAYSADGHARLVRLAAELRALRSRADQPLPDLVADVIRTTGLDIEVAARPDRDPETARAHLDRLLDVATDFTTAAATGADDGVLPGFLAYLAAAGEQERGLEPGEVAPSADAVQILTVHGAKGLEWDVVAVPGLTEECFPDKVKRDVLWTHNRGLLPFPLRGDHADLPQLDLSTATDKKSLEKCFQAFFEACTERELLEERRLAYVAFTRARGRLLLSAAWWNSRDHKKSRPPSRFLREVRSFLEERGAAVAVDAPAPTADAPNPMGGPPPPLPWPADPLDRRRRALETAAAAVRAAAPGGGADTGGDPHGWRHDAALLLAERARRQLPVTAVPLPPEISVSTLVRLRRDPDEVAGELRRPMPQPPARVARRGTAFHAWVEQHYGAAPLLDVDELPGSADLESPEPPDGADLAELQARFLAGEWGRRSDRPDVEMPFETVLAGTVVRGRIDAVFRNADGSIDVVDWKTGRPPGDAAEKAAREVQLAVYRLAVADLLGVPLDRVRAAFHYVRTGETARPVDLLDRTGLEALLEQVPQA